MLLATLVLSLAPAAQDFEITDELLDGTIEAARPLVERTLGYGLPDGPEGFGGARVATTDEIRGLLVEENVPIMLSQVGSEQGALELAESFAAGLAPYLLAKYAFEGHEILVCAEGFERLARLLDMPELLDPGVVRAVIVHELVHAADVPRYAFAESCAVLASPARIQALNAVLEGHAQYVARGVCEALGWSEAFEVYGRAIVADAPDDAGEVERLLRRAQRQAAEAMYVGGERFVAAVEDARGREGIEDAFRDPPQDMAAVHRPEWFLDPSTRPVVRFRLEAPLELLDEVYAERREAGWMGNRLPVDSEQIATAFADLEKPVVTRIAASLRGGLVGQYVAPGMAAQHMLLAIEWSTAADASLVVEASREMLRKRDEKLKEGPVRVLSSSIEDLVLEEHDAAGFYSVKHLRIPGMELDVVTVSLHSGPASLELVLSAETGSKEEILALAGRLAGALRSSGPTEGERGESSEED